ncbi:MAG TPA: gfo/Idh/MocA family oxidoreductase [Armatimonadetes bacterium]|nr:gfo/Idh/MocA family oxidoreductase [Armatimonadota bacterium]
MEVVLDKTVNFAVLGVGVPNQNLGGHSVYNGIGEVHAHFISQTPGARLTACCDLNRDNGEAYARKFSCDFEHDYERLLARPDVDVVVVCTPSGLHGEHTERAARAGKHVIVEKPLEITLAKADSMLTAVRESGVKGVIVFPTRYYSAVNAVRDAINAGHFGTPALINALCLRYRDDVYYSGWRGTWALDGGGACMNQGIHMIDALLYLLDDLATVQARWDTIGHPKDLVEVEDVALALLTFRRGTLGTIQCTTCAWPDHGERIELHAMDGSVSLATHRVLDWQMANDAHLPDLSTLVERDEEFTGHRLLYLEAVPYFRGAGPCRCEIASGRRSLALIEAIYESARQGGAVIEPVLG